VKDLVEIPDNIKNKLEIVAGEVDRQGAGDRSGAPARGAAGNRRAGGRSPPKPDDRPGPVNTIDVNKADLIEQIAQAAEISKSAGERSSTRWSMP